MPEQPQTIFTPWVITLIAALLGFLTAVLMERFKNRIILLKYRKNTFQLATAIQNNFWGNIEVLYNNRKTNHLSLLTVEIKNDSNIDLENVNVDFWVDYDSQILTHQANYVESGNLISLEKDYLIEFNKVVEMNDEDQKLKLVNPNHQTSGLAQRIDWILKNKKLNLPVFNRNTSVKFQILVENFQGKVPLLSLSILHKACKLIPELEEIEITKTRNKYVAWMWLLLSFLTTALIYLKFKNYPYAIVWAGILNILTLYIAFGFYQLLKLIIRLWR